VAAALSAVLARHGFDVTHARSGEEALQALVPESDGFGVVLRGGADRDHAASLV
jgi:CheY-like chemotaxis protein